MSFISSGLLAFSMSTDAFAVSLSKGTKSQKPNILEALKVGAVFGTVEAITPLLGWFAGLVASSFIKEIDHWVAFVILFGIGLKFIYESFQDKPDDAELKASSPIVLILTALATSIDAFAIGISLAFVDHNIIIAALSIGMATFTMVTFGMMAGYFIGNKIGVYAERLGGIGLMLIGSKILLDHLHII